MEKADEKNLEKNVSGKLTVEEYAELANKYKYIMFSTDGGNYCDIKHYGQHVSAEDAKKYVENGKGYIIR